MRDMWELPSTSLARRAALSALVLAIVWAVVAVPLTVTLARRQTPPPPPPATRSLTAMEKATVRYSGQALSVTPITLKFVVTTPNAELHIAQITDASRGVSYGKVTSQGKDADLLVSGNNVLLRATPPFWASVGVPTSEPGWIVVGNYLGDLPFPLTEAIGNLDPNAHAYVDNPKPDDEMVTFHNGDFSAVFTEAGPAELKLGNREAKLEPAPNDARAHLDQAVSTPLPPARLIGASGSLTVSGVPNPPPAPEPASESGR